MSKKVIKKEWKLPKKFKTKWVKALRSGEYKQGCGELYTSSDDTYCCLGVAGKVCGIDINTLNSHGTFDDLSVYDIPKSLPSILQGKDDEGNLVKRLIDFNDNKNLSFKWIASYIERNL